MNNFKHRQDKIWGKNLNQIVCYFFFWLCCFMSITYKPILSKIQIEYNGCLVLQHNYVLLNVKYILNYFR